MRENCLYLVVPCYNEEELLEITAEKLKEKMHRLMAEGKISADSRVLFVNDGSRDRTWEKIHKVYKQDRLFGGLSFSRNFGKEAGIYAGLAQTTGEYVCFIDADLQQRPEITREMVKILDEQPEYDMVAAYQDRRGEGKILSFFKKSFYKIINRERGYANFLIAIWITDIYRRCNC